MDEVAPRYPQVDGTVRVSTQSQLSLPHPPGVEIDRKSSLGRNEEGYCTEFWLPIPKLVAISTGYKAFSPIASLPCIVQVINISLILLVHPKLLGGGWVHQFWSSQHE